MKKTYISPGITVVKLQHREHLLDGSPVNSLSSNAGLCGAGDDGGITGSSGSARTKGFGSIWDEEW